MYKLRACLMTTACVVTLSAGAQAADLPVKAPPYVAPVVYSWTGCSLGLQAGYGWQKHTGDTSSISPSPDFTNFGITSSGGVAGGHVACDYQWNTNWVIGIQGMVEATTMSNSGQDVLQPPHEPEASSIGVRTDAIASITARLGFLATPRDLLYIRGGGAWVRNVWDATDAAIDLVRFEDTGAGHQFAKNQTGWTFGGGWQRRITDVLSVFAEYNYYSFGNKVFVALQDGDDANSARSKQHISTFTVGLNVKVW